MKKIIFLTLVFCCSLYPSFESKVSEYFDTLNLEGNESKEFEDLYLKEYENFLNRCKDIIKEKTGQEVGSRIREIAFCELMASMQATKKAVRKFKKAQ